jgi:hypothetical protein
MILQKAMTNAMTFNYFETTVLIESLLINGGQDYFGIYAGPSKLGSEHDRVGHDIVNDPGDTVTVSCNSRQGIFTYQSISASGKADLMPDIGGDLVRPQAAKGVVHGDTLAESFVDRFFEGIVQVRLPAQDECEAVKGVVVEIHQHLEVFEYSIAQVLGFINGQDKGLFLFLIKVMDPVLYGLEHDGLAAFGLKTELVTQLLVEFADRDGRETDILHIIKVFVQRGFELPETEGFPHAGRSSENADPADVLQIGKAVHHRFLIGGLKGIRYLQGMFVKWVAGQAVESFEIHETSSPSEG